MVNSLREIKGRRLTIANRPCPPQGRPRRLALPLCIIFKVKSKSDMEYWKRITLIGLMTFIFVKSFAQDGSFGLSLEYSPNFSNLTDEFVDARI